MKHFNEADRNRRETEDEAGAHGYGMNTQQVPAKKEIDFQQSLTKLAAAFQSQQQDQFAQQRQAC